MSANCATWTSERIELLKRCLNQGANGVRSKDARVAALPTDQPLQDFLCADDFDVASQPPTLAAHALATQIETIGRLHAKLDRDAHL